MQSVRVNLSVPAKVDSVLAELSSLSGQSKAALVMVAVTWYLPQFEQLRRRLNGEGEPVPSPSTLKEAAPGPLRGNQEDPSSEGKESRRSAPVEDQRTTVAKIGAGLDTPLSRAERRRRERLVRKQSRGG